MDFLNLLLVFILIIISFHWFFTRTYNYWEKQNVTCLANPIPGLGHILPVITLKQNLSMFACDVYQKNKTSAIGFYFIREPGLIVRDPELIKSVLQINFNSFHKNGMQLSTEVDPLMSKHPFFVENLSDWKLARSRFTSLLSGKKLKYLFIIMQEVCSKMDEYVNRKIIKNDGIFECELKDHFTKFTGEIVANAAFQIEGQSFEEHPHRLAFTNKIKTIFLPSFFFGIKRTLRFFFPNIANLFKVGMLPKSADNYFRENIKNILKERKKVRSAPNDFLQFCIDLNGEDNVDNIIADVIVFYGDVYESSSTILCNLFYHLSQNEYIQEKLRHSVISKLMESNGILTYESLNSMYYLEQVIFESIRLMTPFGTLFKKCTENITLKGSDGRNYTCQPGNIVLIPIAALHLDSNYWTDPEIFDPERFNPENVVQRPKQVFLPFGDGPRTCTGMRLGMLLIKIATVSLLTKYLIKHSKKTKFPLEYDTTSISLCVKGGLWAKFQKLK